MNIIFVLIISTIIYNIKIKIITLLGILLSSIGLGIVIYNN